MRRNRASSESLPWARLAAAAARGVTSYGEFQAPRPNALWVSDFTYVSTWTGFVYVAFVIDAYRQHPAGPKPSNATTPCWSNPTWRRDSNETASEGPGAVQYFHKSRSVGIDC
jgi:hypothetical protein